MTPHDIVGLGRQWTLAGGRLENTELDQLLLKCRPYFNYKIQITFLKSNSNTFFNYFGYDGQNTKYIS